MVLYRFDFLGTDGLLIATHAIDYESDQAAIEAGHTINGSPSIGACFQVWQAERLVHWHYNTGSRPTDADERPTSAAVQDPG